MCSTRVTVNAGTGIGTGTASGDASATGTVLGRSLPPSQTKTRGDISFRRLTPNFKLKTRTGAVSLAPAAAGAFGIGAAAGATGASPAATVTCNDTQRDDYVTGKFMPVMTSDQCQCCRRLTPNFKLKTRTGAVSLAPAAAVAFGIGAAAGATGASPAATCNDAQ